MTRAHDAAHRQWTVYEALRSRRRGLTAPSLVDVTGIPRSTVYRYLKLFEGAGLPITKERINGEVRHRLLETALPAFALTADELAALVVARQMLEPLEGTGMVDHLDRLLKRLAGDPRRPPWLSVAGDPGERDRGALRAIDIALREGHRFAFDYASAGDGAVERRVVDPVALRLRGGHTYLIAFDVSARDWRTFKVVRIRGELSFEGDADPHPEYDERALFGHSVGIWSGDPVDVAVRLSPAVADRAKEWPLVADQQLDPQPDGSVIVRARVAGLPETLRWVLGCGADAEALEPAELREAVARELEGAVARYGGRDGGEES